MTQHFPRRRYGLAMAGITAVLWGLLPLGIQSALRETDAVTLVWMRFAISAALLSLWLVIRSPHELLQTIQHPPWLATLAGVMLCVNYYGFARGIALTTAEQTQILIQSGPMVLALAGVIWFKEKMTRAQYIGLGIAVLGLLLFNHRASQFKPEHMALGNTWILLGGLGWAMYAILQKRIVQTVSSKLSNWVIYITATLLLWPITSLQELTHASAICWIVLIALGLNTLIAYGALGEALKYAPANQVSLIIILNPLITLVLSRILEIFHVSWAEAMPADAAAYFGALMVIFGAGMVVLRKGKPE